MLRFEHLIPPGICESIPEDMLFLFFHHRDEYTTILDQIARHIEKMDHSVQKQLEQTLNLQFITTPRDSQGNVCFADDPHLRPEYRTGFHPIDLWDYYYAMWHSSSWWDTNPNTRDALPFPNPDLFWNLVSVGKELRRIHVPSIRLGQYPFSPSFTNEVPVHDVANRYRSTGETTATGRLYLNAKDYLDQVPARTWEYALGNRHFLFDCLSQLTGERLDNDQIEVLMKWIIVIDRTIAVAKLLR